MWRFAFFPFCQLSTLLGLDLLPPTVIRQNVILGGMSFASGSMSFRVRNAKSAKDSSAKVNSNSHRMKGW